MKPSKPSGFVIYGAMRTGSNFLVSILNQFPGVVCHGEAFNPGFVGLREDYYEKFGLTREEPRKRDADVAGFYERVLKQRGTDEISGFKLFPGHDESVLQRTLSDPTLAKIVLKRDVLTSFISLCQAEASGVWMIKDANAASRSASQRRSDVKILFDGPRFLRYRDRVSSFYRQIEGGLRGGHSRYLELWYKDLQENKGLDLLAELLGRELPSEFNRNDLLVKQNLSAPHERVLNVAEMVQFLDSHGYSSGVVEAARKTIAADQADYLRVNGVRINPNVPGISEEMRKRVVALGHEKHEAKCILGILEPGEVLLELGGGLGYRSSLAWLTNRLAKLVVVEANPENIQVMQETHRLNDVQALVINGAATSEAATGEDSVPSVRFHDLLDSHNPTLLVFDMEGREIDLLRGTPSLGSVRKILVKLHASLFGAARIRDMFTHLGRLGYAYDPEHSRQSAVVFRLVGAA